MGSGGVLGEMVDDGHGYGSGGRGRLPREAKR